MTASCLRQQEEEMAGQYLRTTAATAATSRCGTIFAFAAGIAIIVFGIVLITDFRNLATSNRKYLREWSSKHSLNVEMGISYRGFGILCVLFGIGLTVLGFNGLAHVS
jgi:hypothetical protein